MSLRETELRYRPAQAPAKQASADCTTGRRMSGTPRPALQMQLPRPAWLVCVMAGFLMPAAQAVQVADVMQEMQAANVMQEVQAADVMQVTQVTQVTQATQATQSPKPASIGQPAARARIISLAPHITELLYAAGAGDRIVATVTRSDYPPQARQLPRVGDGLNINLEQIIALQPTVVMLWRPGGASSLLEPWAKAAGFALAYSTPASLADIIDSVEHLGTLYGDPTLAREQAEALRAQQKQLHTRYAQRPWVTALIEVGSNPLYTIGNDPLLNSALAECKVRNAYAQARQAAPQVNPEDVMLRQPELILAPTTDPARVQEITRYWTTLGVRAAQQGHVAGINPDALFRPGPRLLQALEAVCLAAEKVRHSHASPTE